MGLGAAGGIRAGIAPYTDAADVDRLVRAVERAVAALRRQRPRLQHADRPARRDAAPRLPSRRPTRGLR